MCYIYIGTICGPNPIPHIPFIPRSIVGYIMSLGHHKYMRHSKDHLWIQQQSEHKQFAMQEHQVPTVEHCQCSSQIPATLTPRRCHGPCHWGWSESCCSWDAGSKPKILSMLDTREPLSYDKWFRFHYSAGHQLDFNERSTAGRPITCRSSSKYGYTRFLVNGWK